MRNIMLIITVPVLILISGCASIVNDSHQPVTLYFSDNSQGKCEVSNKRSSQTVVIPSTIQVRRSDDPLRLICETGDGRSATASIPSKIEGTIAGNILLGGFIGAAIDAETDKHRSYPDSFVIPVVEKVITRPSFSLPRA